MTGLLLHWKMGERDILYTYPTALYEGEQVEKNMQQISQAREH